MKNLRYCSIFFLSVSVFYTNPIVANEATYEEAEEQVSQSYNVLTEIKTGLYNLGNYFGFDLTSTPQTVSSTVFNNPFFNNSDQKTIEQTTVSSLFYILSANTTFPNFFAGISAYQAFDAEANALFNNNNTTPTTYLDAPLDSSNSNSNPINPLSQSLLNILSITPDSNCINSNDSLISNCPFNYIESTEYATALGFQNPSSILTSSTSQTLGDCNDGLCNISNLITAPFLNPNTGSQNGSQAYLLKQIDSSLFLSPLIYNSESLSSQTQSSAEGQGLSNNSQMQAASNYVKYVSGTLFPKSLASQSSIINKNSTISNTSLDYQTRMRAFHDLLGYVLGLRVYAAQMSLPMQNFYESLAKRMVLPTDSSSSQKTSQALNEFVMASYRLYTPSNSNNGGTSTSAWQDMLNTASPATVQKETALILAEINYQLYQMRQQQEKLLLIQSSQLINSLSPPTLTSESK